ncbi:unnamed protein product [Moneuplotes crassus]|uniref:Uncharacterized protein n=1 Tax=Euplotes crassus TaxID=5936 RepID=A0AAD2D1F0_EUPCR|nr:unnamed protein product [Moneuplotes crassus]
MNALSNCKVCRSLIQYPETHCYEHLLVKFKSEHWEVITKCLSTWRKQIRICVDTKRYIFNKIDQINKLDIAAQKAEKNLLQSEEAFDYMIFMISCDDVLLDCFYSSKKPLNVQITKYWSLRLPKFERMNIKKNKQRERMTLIDYFNPLKHPVDALTISAKRTGEKIKWCLPLTTNHPGKLKRVSFCYFLILAKDLKRLFSTCDFMKNITFVQCEFGIDVSRKLIPPSSWENRHKITEKIQTIGCTFPGGPDEFKDIVRQFYPKTKVEIIN